MSKIENSIPFIKPHLPHSSELAADYEAIVASNWFTNFGPFENKFRQAAAEYLDNNTYVTTVANATLGIDLAIRALIDRSEQGKSIIMPSFTFVAGAEAIISNGFTPVFIDINQKDLQPDIDDARNYLNRKKSDVAGILLCNIFGVGNTSIVEWEDLAKEYKIPLIIDTAAGFGSRYDETEKVGARGDCEIFSLHATKPFAIGEGGLVTSKDPELINKVRQLQNFGFGPSRKITTIGTNAKMQEINAAIGLRQLEGFEERLSVRRAVLAAYKEQLPDFVYQSNDSLSTVAFTSILAPNAERARSIHQGLINNGVEARRYYEPLHLQTEISRYALIASDLKTTEDIASRIISLPVHDNMENGVIQRIVDTIKAY